MYQLYFQDILEKVEPVLRGELKIQNFYYFLRRYLQL